MANNLIPPFTGSGDATPVIATEDIDSVHHQKFKIEFGGPGVATEVTSSTPLPVVVQGLPTGANNIGDVDVLTMPATAAESAALPARLTVIAGDDGTDVHPVQIDDASGGVKVAIVSGGSSGISDDTAFTPGSSTVTPTGALFDNVAPDLVDEGDIGAVRMSANRNLFVNIRDAAGNERGLGIDSNGNIGVTDAGSSLTVDGTVTVQDGGGSITVDAASLPLPTGAATAALQTQPGVDIGDVTINNTTGAGAVNIQDGGNSITVDGSVSVSGAVDTELPTAAALQDTTANPTTPIVGAALLQHNGSTWDRVRGDITNGIDVDVTRVSGNVTVVDGGGSLTVDGSVSIGAGLPTGANTIGAVTVSGTVPVTDNGGSLTVDGSVAVTGLPAGANNIGDVDVLTMPATAAEGAALPSAFLVVAGDDGVDTQPLQLDASGNLKVNIQAGAGSGGTALADNAAYTVASTSFTPIGGTYKASRHAISDGSAGAIALTPNRGVYTVLETPTGDSAMDDTNDAVRVNIVAGAGSGGTAITDNATFTVASTSATPIAGMFDNVSPSSVTEGNAGVVRMSANRNLFVTLRDAAGNERGLNVDASGNIGVTDAGASLTVDGAVAINAGLPTGANTIGAVTVSGSVAVTGLPAGANNIGDVDVLTLPGLTAGSNNIGTVNVASGLPTGANTIGAITHAGGLFAGANNIGDVDVLTLPGLATGANNIGDVDVLTLPGLATGANNIGDVDVLTMPGTVVEDVTSAGGATSLLIAGIRNDNGISQTSANGDYGNISLDTAGRVGIADLGGSITIDGSVTVGAGLPTGANTIGAVTVSGTVAVTDNAGSLTVDNPTLSVVGGGTEATALRVTLASDSTGLVSVDDNGGSLTVDGSVAVTGLPTGANNIGDVDVLTLPGLASGANNIGDVDVLTLPGLATGANTIGSVTSTESIADNGGFTDGTSRVFASGFIFDEVAGTALTENDIAAGRINSNRAQVGVIEDGATRGRWATVTAANAVKVDGSAVTQPVSGSVAVTGLPTGANNIGDVDVLTLPGLATGANNIGTVNVASGLPTGANTIGAVTVSGTATVADNQTIADNAGFTDGTSRLFAAGFIFDEVAGTALTENDTAAARVNANRSQTGVVEDGSTRGLYATVLDLASSNPQAVAIVDGSGVQITSFGGGTQYTEDAAAAADPVGTAPILVRADTPAATVTTDGDNIAQRGTNYGAAYVTLLDTSGNPVSVGGGTQYTEDAASAADPVGTVPVLVRVDDPTASAVSANGDNMAWRGSQRGAAYVTLLDGAGNQVASGGSLTVGGSVAVTGLPAGANNIGDVDVLTLPGLASGANNIGTVNVASGLPTGANTIGAVTISGNVTLNDGAQVDLISMPGSVTEDNPSAGTEVSLLIAGIRNDNAIAQTSANGDFGNISLDSAGRVGIADLGGSITVDGSVSVTGLPAGANNIGDVDVLTLPGLASGANNIGTVNVASGLPTGANTIGSVTLTAGTNTNEVVGDVAHDVAAAGNPLLNAGISQNMDDTAPPNRTSAEGRTTRMATDRDGTIFAHPHGPQIWSYHENSSSALTDASVHASPGAGLSLYVTDIVVSTGAATAFNIFFEEGSTTVLGPYYLEATAGRGFAIHFNTPKKITAATALTVTTSAAIAHSIDVTGFTAQG